MNIEIPDSLEQALQQVSDMAGVEDLDAVATMLLTIGIARINQVVMSNPDKKLDLGQVLDEIMMDAAAKQDRYFAVVSPERLADHFISKAKKTK